MKVPVSWLREFVDAPTDADDIARTMSVRGFAVEGVERLGADDAVIDFEVTANRPDCMSVIGIAREVATAYGLAAPREPRLAALNSTDPAGIEVFIDDPDRCPRFAAAVASVTPGPSPEWMQARLRAAGVRPISNIVDITNYVMLELGQPMHAYDRTRLVGGQLRARPARPGESLTTLDGQRRQLAPEILTIADAQRPVGIGGVMGGADSEVSDATREIVLEAAYFSPLAVRRASKALALKTEASTRFERGADPNAQSLAIQRACALLELTRAGAATGSLVDRCPRPIESSTRHLRRLKIAGLLGVDVPDGDVRRILESLGFGVRDVADGWTVTVPSRRVDILREVDLIEEVARHYGFDRLPATFPALAAPSPPIDPRVRSARHLRTVLTASGFSEAVTFGFISARSAAPFAADDDIVAVANPLSESFAVLRPSVLPGLLDGLAHNRNRQQRDVRLFEIGNRFSKATGERRVIACAWTGLAAAEHWSGGARDVDFYDIKGLAERICEALRVGRVGTEQHAASWLVPGRAAALLSGGVPLARLGQLDPAIAAAHGLPASDAVYVAELDLDAAESVAARNDVRVEPLPRFPSVTRDVSVLVDDIVAAESLRETVRRAAPAMLARVREFDRYQGKGVPEGKVSLSLRLTFRSAERTLTDAEVQTAMDAIVSALKTSHGAVQR